MERWRIVAVVALGALGLVVDAACSGHTAKRFYAAVPTYGCLTHLPRAVVGLPPASPPAAEARFVYAFPRDRLPLAARGGVGAWQGKGRNYDGITLYFFKSRHAARASAKWLLSPYGGKIVRNVAVVWDQRPVRRGSFRADVLDCLRTQGGEASAAHRPTPRASLATFAGYWGGHTRGLRINSQGRGVEYANDGCCVRVYGLTFRIASVQGTVTAATATYRVVWFKRDEREAPRLRLRRRELGRLVLRDGILKNELTNDFFCSNPAWGATGACGA